jgi:hypothetical protein
VKKAIGTLMCFLLGGCTPPRGQVISGPTPAANFPHQSTSPRPWVSILPSKRAMDLKAVDFLAITNRIHYNMDYYPFLEKYKNVCLVLVDYRLLPPAKLNQNYKILYHNDIAFSKKYEERPQQYELTVTFYENCKSPPATPVFEETITMATSKAAPQEALRMMIEHLFYDHYASDLKKIEVDFNH